MIIFAKLDWKQIKNVLYTSQYFATILEPTFYQKFKPYLTQKIECNYMVSRETVKDGYYMAQIESANQTLIQSKNEDKCTNACIFELLIAYYNIKKAIQLSRLADLRKHRNNLLREQNIDNNALANLKQVLGRVCVNVDFDVTGMANTNSKSDNVLTYIEFYNGRILSRQCAKQKLESLQCEYDVLQKTIIDMDAKVNDLRNILCGTFLFDLTFQ